MNDAVRRPTRILAVLPSMLPSATIYIVKPLRALARRGLVQLDVALERNVALGQVHWSDVIVFCRNVEPVASWVLDEALAHRKATVYDLDDLLWEVPLASEYGPYFRSAERIRQLEHYLRHVDRVRVYTPRLQRAIERFNPRVRCVRPGIDLSLGPRRAIERDEATIRIAYASGRGLRDELVSIFADALRDVLESYPYVEAVFWRETPLAFQEHPRLRVVPATDDYDAFRRELSSGQYDIGLAPLLATDFYLCKTDTKLRDYGAAHIAGIYSDVEVYAAVTDGETGLLVENRTEAWRDAMVRLVTDRDLRRRIADRAYRFVEENYRQEFLEGEWEAMIADLERDRTRQWRSLGASAAPPAAAPESGRSTRLHLGSGGNVPAGFIGLDRERSPGVKLIADLGRRLPLASDSVDLVLVHRGLERVGRPIDLMREIYRVCRHGAQVCVLAAYSSRATSAAEPFDEHTARLWTGHPDTSVYAGEYLQTEAPFWGLGDSATLDLRCVRMEFFHGIGHRHLRNEEKRARRRAEPGVCDLVLWQLMAIKRPTTTEELEAMSAATTLFEPAEATIRRLEELNEVLRTEYEGVRSSLEDCELRARAVPVRLRETAAELASMRARLADANQELARTRAEASERSADLARARADALEIARELEAHRNRPIDRVIDRFVARTDLTPSLDGAFQQLKDDSALFIGSLDGAELQPSADLRSVPFLPYLIELNRDGLCEILVAPVVGSAGGNGTLGIELVTPDRRIVVQTTVSVRQIDPSAPTRFAFQPVPETSRGRFELRVFARDLDTRLRILEWRRYPALGLRAPRRMAFCGFGFAED